MLILPWGMPTLMHGRAFIVLVSGCVRVLNRWLTTYFKVIVYNNTNPADSSRPQKTYKLSGVGVMDGMVHDNFEVPSDRNMRRRCFRKFNSYFYRRLKDTLFIPPADLLTGKSDDESVYGFPLHATCWTLIERVIGPMAEQHLDILLEAMLDAWDQGGKKSGASVSLTPTNNPLHIAAVKRLVKKLIRRGAVNTKPEDLVSATLPLEIMYMIFDQLDHDELELVLEATGWAVSEEYYRSRFRFPGLIFEIETLRSRLDLDWLSFYREAEEVLEMSDGFKTRCNIMERLGGTRKRFLSRLASEMGHMIV